MISIKRISRKDLREVDRREMELMKRMLILRQREKVRSRGVPGKT